ncbi:MAG TPA: hypothetical protein VHL79_04220 [Ramlibacter sp.]|jgi:hypothetical protein|nr:hypothetical protein [Ramlibacter sp.]
MSRDDTQDAGGQDSDEAQAKQRAAEAREIQPAPSGANRGSPAAPVMKEFQKTGNESSGRS